MKGSTQEMQAAAPRRVDLACGRACAEGFEGADIAPLPGVKHVFNLLTFPWPFEDGSVDELRSSHFIEHVPMAFYTPHPRFPVGSNLTAIQEGPHSVDLLLKFFDECWRVLKPGGIFTVLCPQAHNDRAFQDPTHRRFIVPAFFQYLDRDWRRVNGLEHAAYEIRCHFPLALSKCSHTFSDPGCQAGLMHPKALRSCLDRFWNFAEDLHVVLEKEKE
jgi:SAM-dependent methyltransferase